MEKSPPIELDFTPANAIRLLQHGSNPESSPYSHKQIAEWCEQFWNKYADIDAPDEIEKIMPVLAAVETQWDLFLANSYTLKELQSLNFESVELPKEWFQEWETEARA